MKLTRIRRLFYFNNNTKKCFSTSVSNEATRAKRNELFSKEKNRQESLVTRIKKIEVRYLGVPNDSTLVMNMGLSTPYNCAMHIHEVLCQRSALAEVDGQLWDMHRPLNGPCELKLLNFHTAPAALNKVFWRSCSFLLGMVIEKAFRDDFFVQLHSWPKPCVESGSYVYDADIGVPDWSPTKDELKCFTTMLCKLGNEDSIFERLEVSEELALEMFENNQFKSQQIPNLSDDGKVTLYRVKDHIDISCGPMMGSTKFLGSTQCTAVHQLDRRSGYRFQAVSIPRQLTLNSFAFGVLVDRAKKLNTTGLQSEVPKSHAADHIKELPNEQAALQ